MVLYSCNNPTYVRQRMIYQALGMFGALASLGLIVLTCTL